MQTGIFVRHVSSGQKKEKAVTISLSLESSVAVILVNVTCTKKGIEKDKKKGERDLLASTKGSFTPNEK